MVVAFKKLTKRQVEILVDIGDRWEGDAGRIKYRSTWVEIPNDMIEGLLQEVRDEIESINLGHYEPDDCGEREYSPSQLHWMASQALKPLRKLEERLSQASDLIGPVERRET